MGNGFNTVNGFNGYTSAFAPVLNGLAGGVGSVYGYPFATGFNGSPINGYPVNGYPINGYPTNGSNNLTNGYTTALVNGVPTVVPTTVNGQSTGGSNVGQNTTVSPVLVGSCRAAA